MTDLGSDFMRHVSVDDGDCWLWIGYCKPNGYPQFHVRRRAVYAHRVAFERATGVVPLGDVHHTCGNRCCVNPSHLELVTRAEHHERHVAERTHCRNGHRWTEANTYVAPDGRRQCRTCRREALVRFRGAA